MIFGSYFFNFYDQQDTKTKRKIDFVIDIVKSIKNVPIKFLKFLEGTEGIYEIRVSTSNKNIRIFCFFDEENLVILINCFVKKTNKTPKRELKLAEKLKKQYFKEKFERK